MIDPYRFDYLWFKKREGEKAKRRQQIYLSALLIILILITAFA